MKFGSIQNLSFLVSMDTMCALQILPGIRNTLSASPAMHKMANGTLHSVLVLMYTVSLNECILDLEEKNHPLL